MKRYRLPIFFLLAFLLSWYPWFFALLRNTQTGPNPLGPLVAAIIVTALTEGRQGLKALFARLVRWRVNARWYVAVIGTPVLACLVAGAITIFTGAPIPQLPEKAAWTGFIDRFIFIFLFIGLGEEMGWRGYALPKLQDTRSPLHSSLVLAPIWGLWHLPLFGLEIHTNIAAPFLIGVFSATIFGTWIFNRTRGSVLLQMLFHTTVNTVGAGFMFPMFAAQTVMLWWAYALVWLAISFAVLYVYRIDFTREPQVSAVAVAESAGFSRHRNSAGFSPRM